MKKNFPFPRPYICVPLTIDPLHHGHINILLKAKKYGKKIVVGLMTDKAIKNYKKRRSVIKFRDRKKILKHLDCVDYVIPANDDAIKSLTYMLSKVEEILKK